ncbi:MAG: hypothetical protein RL660_537 [Bacteroidota bacterium]
MLFRYVLIALLCLHTCAAYAQDLCSDKLQEHAANLIHKEKYTKAIALLQKSLSKHPQCIQSYIRLSDLYYRTGNAMLAIGCCNQAVTINSAEGVNATMFLAKQMLYFKQDSMALELLNATAKNKNLNNAQRGFLQNEYLNLFTKLSMQANPSVSAILNLGDSVNTALHQYYPTCDASGNTVLFTGVEKDINEDFLFTTYDSCTGWRKAINLGYPPNTSSPDGSAKWSSDARYLFFTRCNTYSDNGYDGGGCDLMFSYRQNNGEWSGPQIFGATVNSPDYEGQPCLSSDNKTLYFVSDRKGGYGGMDIYKTEFVDGYWQEPVNLGNTVNTKGDELNPFIHTDNKHLYFASNGHTGAGKNDLFVSAKRTDSTWGVPLNLGYPINSSDDENSICVTASGTKAYFASARIGGMGKFDLYTTVLPLAVQAQPSVCVLGILRDKYSGEAIKETRIFLTDTMSGETKTFISNSGDGSYSFSVPANAYLLVTTEDIDGFKPYQGVIDASKATGASVGKDILVKQYFITDTLVQLSFKGSDYSDTNLRYLAKAYSHDWKREPSDSVVLYINAIVNKFADTAMLTTLCFSDSGRLEYLQYVDSISMVHEASLRQFMDFYKKYLIEQGVPEEYIQLNVDVEAIDNKRLLSIETTVVEFY